MIYRFFIEAKTNENLRTNMSSIRQIRRDDFDIESIDRINERDRKSRASGSRTRSRSRKRSYSRRRDDSSRSRSRSVERRRHRRARDSYSRSPSRSRSRSRSYRRSHSKRSDRRHTSKKYRDSRSRSNSRSRSRSKSYGRNRRGRYRYDVEDVDKYRKTSPSRSRSRSRSHSRSRSPTRSMSRSSSQFGDYKTQEIKKQNDTPSKPSTSSAAIKMQEENNTSKDSFDNLEDLPLPQPKPTDKKSNTPYQLNSEEPIDRARIHREMEEKLRAELAKVGKVYPPPKPEASHPVFANDGSFLEIFKKMQQAQASTSSAATSAAKSNTPVVPAIAATAHPSTAPYLAAAAAGKSAPPPPLVGRRRGGKILKTGVVAKPKIQTDANADPKDFWSLYLAEVNKYKNTACESEQGNRPLVK